MQKKNIKWWVGLVSCILLFVSIVSYAFIKMKAVVEGVQITANIDTSAHSGLVKIAGMADKAIYLRLNGREISIDKQGAFTEQIALPPGLSVITIEAQDKFGKISEKEMKIVYYKNNQVALINN